MPIHAKVLIFDDDRDSADLRERIIKDGGHVVIAKPASIEELEQIMPTLEQPDVALVDNMGHYSKNQSKYDLLEVGPSAARLLEEKFGKNITIVAFTTTEHPSYGEIHFNPINRNTVLELSDLITQLPSKDGPKFPRKEL